MTYDLFSFAGKRTFKPPQQTVPTILAFTIAALRRSYLKPHLQLTEGCPRFSFSVQLAPWPLPQPHCRWGSHNLATASLVPRAPCPLRARASLSGVQPSLQARPLPIIPPQVCLNGFHCCCSSFNFKLWFHVIQTYSVCSLNCVTIEQCASTESSVFIRVMTLKCLPSKPCSSFIFSDFVERTILLLLCMFVCDLLCLFFIKYPFGTVSNMANPKEKTPMCLVNELARFNKIQPEYKLLCEQGPAHSKVTHQTNQTFFFEAVARSLK